MNRKNDQPPRPMWLLVTLCLTTLAVQPEAIAQQVVPAPDGTDTQINNTGEIYEITGGKLSLDGANLFHSFTKFNLSEGQIANFLSNPEIQNILGRINGGDPSVINGLIQVTGGNSNLFLLNPAGIIFGPNASLDVPAAFNASTATGIGFDDDNWFYAFGENDWASLVGTPNAFRFDPIAPGIILNEGNLTVATGESITLLGGTVINTGTIKAPSGTITVQAVPGQSLVRISQAGDLLSLDIIPETDVPITPLSLPELLTGSDIDHASSVSVNERGHVLLTGSGITVSPSQGGAIASGTLDASSGSETELAPGGTVRVMGDRVGVVDGNINVSGNNGGGNVLIGGDGTSQTYISMESAIAADAIGSGNGGRVRIAAEEGTGFYGTVTARGVGGNGGRVEIVGRGGLDVANASVNASAPEPSNPGTWLLESSNIIIGNNPINPELGIENNNYELGTPNSIKASDIGAALNNGTNVTISSRGGKMAGQISVEAPINKTDGVPSTVSLNAVDEIFVNADISTVAEGFNPVGGMLNVILSAGGDIVFNSDMDAMVFSNGGDIRLTSKFGKIIAGSLISRSDVENGGDITLQAWEGILTGEINSFSPSRGGHVLLQAGSRITTGNINAAGAISSTKVQLHGPVIIENDISIDAGKGGSITFEGTVDGNQELTLNTGAGTVQFKDTVGGTERLSGVTVASGNILVADGVYTKVNQGFEGRVFLTESATFDAESGEIAFHDEVIAGAQNLTLTADEIEIVGLIRGGGSLLLQPSTPSLNIALGTARQAESLSLTSRELSGIQDWERVTIGRSNSRSRMTVTGEVNFSASELRLRSGGTIDTTGSTLTNNGAIELLGTYDIKTGNITSPGENITIVSNRGNIDTSAGLVDTSSATGDAGAIALVGEDIKVGDLSAEAYAGTGNGGKIRLHAEQSINGQPGTSISSVSVEGAGGDVELRAEVRPAEEPNAESPHVVVRHDIRTGNIESSGYIRGGDITINGGGNIDTSSGNLLSISDGGEGGRITLEAPRDAITGAINSSSQTGDRGGDITINSTNGNIDTLTGDLISEGGDITLQAEAGTVRSGNINASGEGQGGQISIRTSGDIQTGALDTSAMGNGGNVTLDGTGDITVEYINTEGGSTGRGGDVAIGGRLFRATGQLETPHHNAASISTAGGAGGGAIAIRHQGARELIPFVVGEETNHGTSGAITSGEYSIEPSHESEPLSFSGGTTVGNIVIETNIPGIPLSEESPPPPEEEVTPPLPAPPEEDLTPGENISSPPEDIPQAPDLEVTSPLENEAPEDIQDVGQPPDEEVASPEENLGEQTSDFGEGEQDVTKDTDDLGSTDGLPDDVPEGGTNEPLVEPGAGEGQPDRAEAQQGSQAIDENSGAVGEMERQQETDGPEAQQQTEEKTPVGAVALQNGLGGDRELYSSYSQREQQFTSEFAEYLQIPSDKYKQRTLEDARALLGKIEQMSGVKPAIVYITFANSPPGREDNLELVLVTSDGLPVRYRVQEATRSRVMSRAQEFYREVTNRRKLDTTSYLPSAQQLYRWMIQPIRDDLQARGIQNLVFIMDGGLRSLPMAALHDGKEFLVQQYSFGLMPSLTLSDASYVDIKKQNLQILAMGASEFLEHAPLPAVPLEIETIAQEWGGKFLLNEAFTFDNLKTQLAKGSFGIIHLATHAEFRPGVPSNSYIQMWSDRKLHLDEIGKLGWDKLSVDLVVLSACQTALGNEEAEFGFAGFAVKAGVKSALASLWYVSDEGTLGLMSKFYQQLKRAPIKAEALKQAQVAMIEGRVHSVSPARMIEQTSLSHPYFWSAFTMIGNPW